MPDPKTMPSFSRILRRAMCTATVEPTATTTQASTKPLSTDLYNERNLKLMVEKFIKSSNFPRFRAKTSLYDFTVRRLASAKRFNYIERILEHQNNYEDMKKEGFVARIITLYGKSGMFDHAKKVFDKMPERNCARTVFSFNALLGACVNARKLHKLDELFRGLPKVLEIVPDVVSYNIVIKGKCEMGCLDDAVAVFDEMGEKGLVPDLITYNTLLVGLYGNNRYGDGEKKWSVMEEKGVVPDIRSYNAKLMGLVSEKRVKEAVELVDTMSSRGVKPDLFTLNTLIKGFVADGDLENVKQCYEEIKRSEHDPDKMTFSLIVPFACEKGDVDFALELCGRTFEINCLVDEALLQRVVDNLVTVSRTEEAKNLVKLGKRNKFCRYRLKLPEDE